MNEGRTRFSIRMALAGGITPALVAQRSGMLMPLVTRLTHAIAKRSTVASAGALSGADQ